MTYYYRLKAQQLKTIGKGRHCDGQGLYYNSRGAGRRQWELRFSLWGVEQCAGLGGYPAIGLKEARDRAEEARRHMPALHWKDVPAFYTSLNDFSIDHFALRLLILSGVRSEPIRNLTLAQIEGEVWTVPAQYVKGREGQAQPFRVPLGQEALAVIALAKQHETNGFLLPNSKGKALDRMALITLMKRLGTDARPHGFRSAVRTWISETTETAHDVAEACIGHLATDKVVKAYKRTDYFEKRVPIMMEWEKYVTGSKS